MLSPGAGLLFLCEQSLELCQVLATFDRFGHLHYKELAARVIVALRALALPAGLRGPAALAIIARLVRA